MAESILRLAEDHLNCVRSQLLVVVPEERTGIRGLSEAVEKRLAVAVAKIDRGVLEGEMPLPTEIAALIRRYGGVKIVILDESTVTYSTLNKLDEIVRNAAYRYADLKASIVELPIAGSIRPNAMVSLIRWSPLRFVSNGGVT